MDPKAVDAALAQAQATEAVLRAFVDDMVKHFEGGNEPLAVAIARVYVAKLPAPQSA